jgi:hypothetical protein
MTTFGLEYVIAGLAIGFGIVAWQRGSRLPTGRSTLPEVRSGSVSKLRRRGPFPQGAETAW